MSSLVYLNGEYLPLQEAKVSVTDRGFLFGDGVYEVIPCYNGRPFRLEHHLMRLAESLRALGIKKPLSNEAWREIIERLTLQRPGEEQSIYLQITRGNSGKRDPGIPRNLTPTVFAMSQPVVYPDPATFNNGVTATTHDDSRWHHCNIKAITLLANILLRKEAVDQGSADAILVRDGHATEGATSNLFIVDKGIIITPPESDQLLPGVTRNLVLELAQAHELPFREEDIPIALLRHADEVWLTSSTREVMAVVTLDGKQVGNGAPGPIYQRIRNYYTDFKAILQADTTT
ncbi:MAG: D-amino acid aminotransferase [Candidatus Sedimenticola sp. (ex Thyasira tokunagai)]